jgi:hypothetical protein
MLSRLLLFAILATPIAPTPAATSDLIVPNFRDLTVKTLTTMGGQFKVEITWYFKGARQRTENHDPAGNPVGLPYITQCDQGVGFWLNKSSKTYNSRPLDWAELKAEMKKTPSSIPQPEMSGGELTVATDSVDTGEQRQFGSYEAHRIKTTITAEPGPSAVSKPSKTEIDGWYIDIPGMNCKATGTERMGWSVAWSGRQDRIVFKQLGAAPLGLPVEITQTKTEDGRVSVTKTEFVQISEQLLDGSLFEVPAGYSAANTKR